jgi:hypothetical protein
MGGPGLGGPLLWSLAAVPLLLLAGPTASLAEPAAQGVLVRFELNDAQVKGRLLAGVSVRVSRPGGEEAASGVTGADGRFEARVAPGPYQVSYRLEGYVPYTSEATELRAEGQLVTASWAATCASSSTGARSRTR